MKKVVAVLSLLIGGISCAETPQELVQRYTDEAITQQRDFRPSPSRGEAFYQKQFNVSERMPACMACHQKDPHQPGRHAVTNKAIKPLSPQAEPARFTQPAKVEKWFRRNCQEVVGRPCTPQEKADFIQFLIGGTQ